MTQNEHVCAICCRPELDCYVVSGRNIKTVVDYVVVNFKAATSSSFRDIKTLFRDDGGGGGGGRHGDSIKRKRIRISLEKKLATQVMTFAARRSCRF